MISENDLLDLIDDKEIADYITNIFDIDEVYNLSDIRDFCEKNFSPEEVFTSDELIKTVEDLGYVMKVESNDE